MEAPFGCDGGMPRVFIGLPLPASLAEPLAARAADALGAAGDPDARGISNAPAVPGGPDVPDGRGAPRGVRVYPARDLHLTLCFLGELASGVGRLARALEDETRGLAAPELSLAGVGAFPGEGAPRVLWAGVVDATAAEGRLAALRNRALTAALGFGWRPPAAETSRPFRPHVTLARVAADPRPALDLRAFRALAPRGSWVASEVVLYESDPGRPGSRYRALAEAPLLVRPG